MGEVKRGRCSTEKLNDASYMSTWIDFYDFKHSVIYVNARHRDVHYRTIAEDIRKLVPSPAAHVLDYGCGEATSADLVALACAQLILVEQRPTSAPRSRCAMPAIRRSPSFRPSKPPRCPRVRSISSSCIRSRNI